MTKIRMTKARIKRRTLAILLAAACIVTSMPGTSLTANAQVVENIEASVETTDVNVENDTREVVAGEPGTVESEIVDSETVDSESDEPETVESETVESETVEPVISENGMEEPESDAESDSESMAELEITPNTENNPDIIEDLGDSAPGKTIVIENNSSTHINKIDHTFLDIFGDEYTITTYIEVSYDNGETFAPIDNEIGEANTFYISRGMEDSSEADTSQEVIRLSLSIDNTEKTTGSCRRFPVATLTSEHDENCPKLQLTTDPRAASANHQSLWSCTLKYSDMAASDYTLTLSDAIYVSASVRKGLADIGGSISFKVGESVVEPILAPTKTKDTSCWYYMPVAEGQTYSIVTTVPEDYGFETSYGPDMTALDASQVQTSDGQKTFTITGTASASCDNDSFITYALLQAANRVDYDSRYLDVAVAVDGVTLTPSDQNDYTIATGKEVTLTATVKKEYEDSNQVSIGAYVIPGADGKPTFTAVDSLKTVTCKYTVGEYSNECSFYLNAVPEITTITGKRITPNQSGLYCVEYIASSDDNRYILELGSVADSDLHECISEVTSDSKASTIIRESGTGNLTNKDYALITIGADDVGKTVTFTAKSESGIVYSFKFQIAQSSLNQAPYYETKLALTARAKTIYPGQTVTVATAKFSGATTCRSLSDTKAHPLYLKSDNKTTKTVRLDADKLPGYIPEADEVAYALSTNGVDIQVKVGSGVKPGKFIVRAYSEYPRGGQPASATMSFSVGTDVSYAVLNVPATSILKNAGKAATVKLNISIKNNLDKTQKPKKTEWSLIPQAGLDLDRVKIKNGTVSVAKEYEVSSIAENNRFVVCAAVTGKSGLVTYAYSPVMEITSQATVIEAVKLSANGTEYTDAQLMAGLTTDELAGASLVAYSKYVAAGSPENVIVSNDPLADGSFGSRIVTYTSNSKAVAIDKTTGALTGFGKPGTARLTVTATDGGKSSASLTLKTTYYGSELKLIDETQNKELASATTLSSPHAVFYVGYPCLKSSIMAEGGNPEIGILGSPDAPVANYKIKAAKGKITKAKFLDEQGREMYWYQALGAEDTITLTNLTSGEKKEYRIYNPINESLPAQKLKSATISTYTSLNGNTTVSIKLKNWSSEKNSQFSEAIVIPDQGAQLKNINTYAGYEKVATGRDDRGYPVRPLLSVNSIDSGTGEILLSGDNGIKPTAANGSYKFKVYLVDRASGKMTKPLSLTIKVGNAPKATVKIASKYTMGAAPGAKIKLETTKMINAKSLSANSIGDINKLGSYNHFSRYFTVDEAGNVCLKDKPQYSATDDQGRLDEVKEYYKNIPASDLTGWVNYTYEDLSGEVQTGSAKITVTLSEFKLNSVTITNADKTQAMDTLLNQEIGGTIQLGFITDPENYPVSSAEWSSVNKSIATVNSTGLVTFKKDGMTAIRVTVNGTTTASLLVGVGSGGITTVNVCDPTTWPKDLRSTIEAAIANEYNGNSDAAKPDDDIDDTERIKQVIETIAIHNKVTGEYRSGEGYKFFIPKGTYYVDIEKFDAGIVLAELSNLNIELDSEAKIKAMKNGRSIYSLIYFAGCTNCTISGGKLEGEDKHTGSSGEWGIGIQLERNNNIVIDGMEISHFWGDGIRVSDNGYDNYNGQVNNGVYIRNCNVHNNRRNNITITKSNNIVIENCKINNAGKAHTGGTAPKFGIDVEHNHGAGTGLTIKNCTFSGNVEEDIGIIKAFNNITITNCTGKKPRNDVGASIKQSGNSWQ